jgi:hypothetical protein
LCSWLFMRKIPFMYVSKILLGEVIEPQHVFFEGDQASD